MGLALLAVATASLLGTAMLTVSALGVRRRVDAVLSVSVLTVALVTADSLALGLLHLFSRWFLVGLAVAQLVVAVLVAARPAARQRALALLRQLRAGFRDLGQALLRNPFAAILTLGVVLVFTWRGFVSAAIGVQDYDGLSYHMPMVLSWVQDHQIGQRIPVNPFANTYPGNLELQAAWAMAINGTAQFAGLAQAPFVLIAWLAVLAIGRRCGLPRNWAVAAASLFTIMPAVIVHVGAIYNDVAAAAMFLAGAHLAGRTADHLVGSRSWFSHGLLAGIALGVTAGMKPGFVFGAGATVLVLVVAAWRRTHGWRRPLALLATLTVPIALLGAAFYVRNILYFGNPLAPFALDLGPIHLPGDLDLTDTVILPSTPLDIRHLGALITPAIWFGYDVSVPYYRLERSFGVQWPLLLLPALVAWLVLVIVRKRTWYYATLLLPMAGVFFTHPTPWVFRYVLFIVAPAAVAFCLGLRWLANRPHRTGLALATVLCLVSLWSVCSPMPMHRLTRTGHPGITTVRVLGPAQLVREVLAGKSLQIFDQPGAAWVRDLPDGTTIGVADTARRFPTPLYGERAQHRIVRMSPWISDNDSELTKQGIEYLFLIDGDATATWVQKQPRRFTLVSRTGDLLAYRVVENTRSRTD